MKPANLLFILSDEHRRDALGCYGHPLVQTPQLDNLANRGVRFDAAYTNCPICVPARASLATGQYVHQIRYWDNAFPYEGRVKGWGHRLIEQGHRVDSIGKLHYRSEADEDGFTNHILPLNVVDGIGDVMGSIRDQPPVRNGARKGILDAGPGTSTYLDYDEEIAKSACEWLGQAADGQMTGAEGQPWMLFVSFVCPHPPFIAPPDLYEMYPLDKIPMPVQNRPDEWPMHPALAELRKVMEYDQPFTEEEVRRVTAAYYGACTHLDRQIGKVLETLTQTGLVDDTRIIYTSDHGENMGCRGLWGKFSMYEESAGVPFIMAGPDVPQGEVCSDMISLVDCSPTILAGMGLDPESMDQEQPGTSLWPLSRGEKHPRVAFSEYHAVASRSASYMLRDGKFKLIYYVNYPSQLFDLDTDPLETTNLADNSDYQDVLADLEEKLRQIVDTDAVDEQAKNDQQALVAKYGGREAVLERGTFINSPVPGETPQFNPGS